jgi:hypothetical protein
VDHQTTRRITVRATIVSVLALAGSAGTAGAQNALGDGRLLDNNLSAQGTANTPVRDLDAEIRFRNAIVTGNAPGGLSFRGDVGYTAPGEFRGELGSDSTFAFRRDSLVSGLAGAGIRGIDALQYQMALTTGSMPPQSLVGGYTVARDGFSVDSPRPGFQPAVGQPSGTPSYRPGGSAIARRPATDERADDRGTLLWTLRSPSAYVANQGFNSTLLAAFNEREQRGRKYGLTASGLRSIRVSTLEGDPGPERDQRGSAAGGAAQPVDTRMPSTQLGTLHDRVLERLAGEEDDDPAVSQRARIEQLRSRLIGAEPLPLDTPDDEEATEGAPPTGTGEQVPATEQGSEIPGVRTPPREYDTSALRLDAELRATLRAQELVRELIDQDAAETDPYGEHIVAGERLIARGKYFDAEERFAHAIAQHPGDVTAQIGRVHAQLGAGLFTSAAVNLRGLLVENPELALTRYAPDLLPAPERLETLRADLRAMLTTDPASPSRRVGGLLLAYLGYQSGDTATVREALDALDAVQDESRGSSVNGRLLIYLRSAWLDGGTGG